MDTKALIEERVKLHEDNKKLVNDNPKGLSAEQQAEFDRRDARMVEIKRAVDNQAKVDDEERALGESRGRQTTTIIKASSLEITEEDHNLAVRAWALGRHINDQHTSPRLAMRMREACEKIGLRSVAQSDATGYLNKGQRDEIEFRALSAGNTSAGGYSVPDEMMQAYVEVQKWYGRVEANATVLNTVTGAPLPIPVVDDTANTGEIIDEAAAVTTTADPVFSLETLGGLKYSSKAVIVSVELLQDNGINLPQYLGRALGTRIARIKNTDFTTGDNSGNANGIVTASSLGKTAALTNAITWDEVIDLLHSVDIAYRSKPKASFMMHDTIAAYIRKLKDSQNRYLWEISLQAGMPDRILGFPVIINNDMASVQTTSAKIMLFGDMESYYVRNAGPVVFARADELRLLNHQVVFVAYQRADGGLPDVTAVRHLKNA